MPTYDNFEDLPVWQEAARLYNAVLDLLEEPGLSVSAGFRNQLDRAALSISNNIAERFERRTTGELVSFIGIARGSAGEVRSMLAVVKGRPKLKVHLPAIQRIATLAKSCARQLMAWQTSIGKLPFDGSRALPERERRKRELERKARSSD